MRIRVRIHDKTLKDMRAYDSLGYIHLIVAATIVRYAGLNYVSSVL